MIRDDSVNSCSAKDWNVPQTPLWHRTWHREQCVSSVTTLSSSLSSLLPPVTCHWCPLPCNLLFCFSDVVAVDTRGGWNLCHSAGGDPTHFIPPLSLSWTIFRGFLHIIWPVVQDIPDKVPPTVERMITQSLAREGC